MQTLGLFGGPILWGVEPWRLAAALGIVFAGFASRKLIHGLFVALGRRTKENAVKWDDEAARLLPKPLALVAQMLLWRVAAGILALPTEPVDVASIVAQGLEAAVMVGIVWTLFRVVDVLASVADRFADTTKTRIDDQAIPLLRKTLKVFLAVIGGVFIISNMGINVLGALAGLGIGGLALALAAQDSVANFFGSVVLFTDAPFQVGDEIEVEGVSGVVEEVGFRTTRIRQDNSTLVCVPNQTFTGSFITNISTRTGRAVDLEWGIAPDAHPEQIAAFLVAARGLVEGHDNVVEGTGSVFLEGMKNGAIWVDVFAVTKTTGLRSLRETREALFLGLLRAVEAAGLRLADPARTVVVSVPRSPAELPAHELPAAELPAAELPAAELPAAALDAVPA